MSKPQLSTERLLASIAHEINNPATAVMANLNLLRDFVERTKSLLASFRDLIAKSTDPQLLQQSQECERKLDYQEVEQEFADAISESLYGMERIRQVISSLKFLGGGEAGSAEILNLTKVAGAAVSLLRSEIVVRAELGTALEPDTDVRGARTELQHVVLNLLTNAIQAISVDRSKRGKIRVSCRRMRNQVRLDVHDSGPGIRAEDLVHCFDPDLVVSGRGSGLALAVAKDLAVRNGGGIEVESRLGEGTSLVLWLPAVGDCLPTSLSG